MRLGQCLLQLQQQLSGDSARLEAELLLMQVLAVDRIYLRCHGERELTHFEQQQLTALVQRRQLGEPIAYLLGHQEFWSLDLQVSPAVLIPRADTETLVEQALLRIPMDNKWTIADLGTGSGAIALAVASERPHCRVLATDRSLSALAIAQANAQRLQLAVEFFAGDWLSALPVDCRLDMILSNPPYIAAADPHLAALSYEPITALVAAEHGLKDLSNIAQQARALLKPQGWLLLEHGYDQANAVQSLLEQLGYQNISTVADLAGNDRVSLANWSSL